MVCKNCGKSLVRGYSFCMECGSPVPPEALEEAGMPPRTGDHADNPSGKPQESKPEERPAAAVPDEPTGGMPDVKPLMAGGSTDGEDSGGKTLVFCTNCGTVMQSNPYTCEKCGLPLADRPNGIPLFRDPDELSEGLTGIEEDMNLSEMLGMGGLVEEDVMQDEAAKMFGISSGMGVEVESDSEDDSRGNEFSAADLEMLTMQMSKYSQSTVSQMPMVGRDIPEPEPIPETPPQPVDKDAPIIAETEFIPESVEFGEFIEESASGASPEFASHAAVEPMHEPQRESYPAPKPVELTKTPPPQPMTTSPVSPQPAPGARVVPDPTVSDRDDYLLDDNPPPPEKHMPKYMYFGFVIILLCITMGIIFANLK